MKVQPPAFTMVRPSFPAPTLLRTAAEAPHGGGREALMAAVMAIRLLAGRHGAGALAPAIRSRRAEGIRGWLPAVTLAPKVRTAVLRVVAASEHADPNAAATALEALGETLAGAVGTLPRGVHLELAGLADRIRRG